MTLSCCIRRPFESPVVHLRESSVADESAPALSAIQDLYDRCLYLQAFRLAEQRGPLASWKGTAERILAGRLAFNLGAIRMGSTHHIRAWRQARTDIDATYYYSRALLSRFGALPAWRFLDSHAPKNATPIQQADFASMRATVAGLLRDFDAAEMWLKLAMKFAPQHTWTFVEQSSLLEMQDKYDAALESAEAALHIRPWFRPAVQSRGHLLVLAGRDDEALAFLEEASRRIESNAVVWQLAELQNELGLSAQMHESVERLVELTPLSDPKHEEWLNSQRCDAAYRGGNYELARELAGKIDVPYYKLLKQNMDAAGPDAKRVMLNVPFVRQHRVTCAPATLSAISRLWNMPADHLSVAEEICYDGTPYASERKWAEKSGWVVREFTLNWDAAVALIDRGVAFTLTTTEITNGHLQAVIGYDSRKKVLLVRDPFVREVREFLAEQTLERYKPFGPRAMAMVPLAEAHRLDGIDLADVALWDQCYQVTTALNEHQRDKAAAVQKQMAETAPDHRLTIDSRLSLAAYDADPATELDCINQLIAKFPECRLWVLLKSQRLRRLERREDYTKLLREQTEGSHPDAVFMLLYAATQRPDARHWPKALKLTRRALRRSHEDANAYSQLAAILWDMRRFEEALQAYRVAACVGDKIEQMAESYFIACRHFNRGDEALKFLRDRFARFGKRSPEPGKTLFWALDELGRSSEAFETLDETLKLHPNDGTLMLFAAEMHARRGNGTRAAELIKQAKGRCRQNTWLRTAAVLSYYWGKLEQSLQFWQKVIELEPLAIDAHRAATYRLEEVKGRAVALAHLNETVERFPHQLSLREFQAEWLRRDDIARCEQALRKLIELHPENAWAHRELGSVLCERQQYKEAAAAMKAAHALEPENASYFNIMGDILARAGKAEEGRKLLRKGIELEIDNDWAIRRLVSLADSLPQRKAELQFIAGRLRDSVTFGSALLAFHEEAGGTLEPAELTKVLRDAHASRPDLWHAWSALGRHLMHATDLAGAVKLLKDATARFPLHPKLWLDLAEGYRLQLDRPRELEALRKAVNVRPDWLVPLRKLAEAHDREGEIEQSRKLLERAVTRDPVDPVNHGMLADALWKLDQKEAAIAAIEKALGLAPNYNWAWGRLDEWCRAMNAPQRLPQLARQIAERRPGDPDAWIALSDALYEGLQLNERLAALDKAIALAPRNPTVHDRRAVLLTEARRFDEARKACRPAAFGDQVPIHLKGRAAWIEAERGSLDQAITLMRSVLREDDSYYWGWTKLTDWCRAKKDIDGLVAAAGQLVRLGPNDPQSLGNLAEAKLMADDRAGAKAALVRAFALAPDYDYAGNKLFEFQLDDKEFHSAAVTLERHKPHMAPGAYLAFRVMLGCRAGDHSDAINYLRQLVRTACDRWCIDMAAHEMQKAGWVKDIDNTISAALGDPAASLHAIAALTAAHAADNEHAVCEHILRTVRDSAPKWTAAMEAYLDVAGRNKQALIIRKLIKRDREPMHRITPLWALTGYALLQIDNLRGCVEWMKDWQERADAKPWMLVNIADSLRCLGRSEEALAINQYALSLPPDHGSVHHELWLAFEAACAPAASASPGAAHSIDHIEPAALDPYLRILHQLVTLLQESRDGDAARARSNADIRRDITALIAANAMVKTDISLKMAAKRAVAAIAAIQGSMMARLWRITTWFRLQFRGK